MPHNMAKNNSNNCPEDIFCLVTPSEELLQVTFTNAEADTLDTLIQNNLAMVISELGSMIFKSMADSCQCMAKTTTIL